MVRNKEDFEKWVLTWCDGVETPEYSWELFASLQDRIVEAERECDKLARRYIQVREYHRQLQETRRAFIALNRNAAEFNRICKNVRAKLRQKT